MDSSSSALLTKGTIFVNPLEIENEGLKRS